MSASVPIVLFATEARGGDRIGQYMTVIFTCYSVPAACTMVCDVWDS